MKHISFGILPSYMAQSGAIEYLVLQNTGGFWGFPKGHSEAGESPEGAAIREAFEEAGIVVGASDLGEPIHYDYEQFIKGVMQMKRIVLFPARLSSKEVELQASEIKTHKWVSIEEAAALINIPSATAALRALGAKA